MGQRLLFILVLDSTTLLDTKCKEHIMRLLNFPTGARDEVIKKNQANGRDFESERRRL